ncbi:MAG: alpha/beta fold hydrolase [Methanocella sp.]
MNSFIRFLRDFAMGSRMDMQVVALPDGRQLGYCSVGQGRPVVYFHGTASSRLEALLLKDMAQTAGLQLVGIDRPGYGLSSYRKLRSLSDFNSDVTFLADQLGFEPFSVLGWSGGGAFALAYTAQNSQRVTKAVVADAPFLPFDVSMAHDFPFSKYLMKIPYAGYFAIHQLRRQVLKANGNIPAFLKSKQAKQLLRGYTESDLELFSDPAWAALMYQSMAEAFRQKDGVRAVVGEHMLFLKDWGFPVGSTPAEKLVVWHGKDDKTIGVQNGVALAGLVAGCRLEVFEGKGHCAMFHYPDKLAGVLLE